MDFSQPGFSVHGILQARIQAWVASPSPGDLPDPGIKAGSPALQADSLTYEPPGKTVNYYYYYLFGMSKLALPISKRRLAMVINTHTHTHTHTHTLKEESSGQGGGRIWEVSVMR